MAGIFEDVRLVWDGVTYTIPSNKVMGAIARIEQHVTLTELYMMVADRAKVRMTPLAKAYASVLSYAGAKDLDDEQVYIGLFGIDRMDSVTSAINGLLELMIPPTELAKMKAAAEKELRNQRKAADAGKEGAPPPGKPNRAQRRAAASRSSRKRSEPRTRGGSSPPSSGSSIPPSSGG